MKIYQQLYEDNQDVYLADYAMGLINLGLRQRLDRDSIEKALQNAHKGVKYFEELCEINPKTYAPYLVWGLATLATIYEAAGQIKQARDKLEAGLLRVDHTVMDHTQTNLKRILSWYKMYDEHCRTLDKKPKKAVSNHIISIIVRDLNLLTEYMHIIQLEYTNNPTADVHGHLDYLLKCYRQVCQEQQVIPDKLLVEEVSKVLNEVKS